MKNILLKLCFDGSGYHGWQSQKNASTVSGELLKAIKRVTNEDVKLYGCSRTDAFVHAINFYANFETKSAIPPQRFYKALNTYLPKSIRILKSQVVDNGFHSRFSCIGKEYIYKVYNSNISNPFYENKVTFYKGQIEADFLNKQAQAFVGTHDFRAFMAAGSSVVNTIRTIKYFNVIKKDDIIIFRIYADGFLYKMVRIIVGTLLDVSAGKIKEADIIKIIKSKDRKNAGKTALPHGLYLSHAEFKEDITGGSNGV